MKVKDRIASILMEGQEDIYRLLVDRYYQYLNNTITQADFLETVKKWFKDFLGDDVDVSRPNCYENVASLFYEPLGVSILLFFRYPVVELLIAQGDKSVLYISLPDHESKIYPYFNKKYIQHAFDNKFRNLVNMINDFLVRVKSSNLSSTTKKEILDNYKEDFFILRELKKRIHR